MKWSSFIGCGLAALFVSAAAANAQEPRPVIPPPQPFLPQPFRRFCSLFRTMRSRFKRFRSP